MSYSDIQSLAQLLDRNHGFKRPDGQSVGYSLQETAPTAVVNHGDSAAAPNPSNIPLPATVIDQQLCLPIPSESREAKRIQAKQHQARRPKGYAIWTDDELNEVHQFRKDTTTKPRDGVEEPEYTILHQEKVTAEDLYLGMDFTRTGSSGLLVKITMPKQARIADVAIEVDPYEFRLSSTKYFLRAALPQKVFAGKAYVRWNVENKTLEACLYVDDSDRLV